MDIQPVDRWAFWHHVMLVHIAKDPIHSTTLIYTGGRRPMPGLRIPDLRSVSRLIRYLGQRGMAVQRVFNARFGDEPNLDFYKSSRYPTVSEHRETLRENVVLFDCGSILALASPDSMRLPRDPAAALREAQ